MREAVKELKQGQYLFLQGHMGNELYFLKSGALDVILSPSSPDLTESEVQSQGQVIDRFDQPGQMIGEISPILQCPRTASVRAAQDSVLQVADMTSSTFENAVRLKPMLGIKIAEELARRISKTNEKLKKQDMRLLRFLEEVRVALSAFFNDLPSSVDLSNPELAGNVFLTLSKLSLLTKVFPADLPVSLALPYDQVGAFFSYFGGVTFESSKLLAHAASAAEALAKVQGKRYASGEFLCTSGEEARELFILLQGRLDVVVGRRTIQTIQGRGNMVGEMAFLLKTRRTASVIAVDSAVVLAVPFEKMEPLFKRVPQLLMLMLRQLAVRLLRVDVLVQKSTWRNLFFNEILPAFVESIKSSVDAFPASFDDAAKTMGQKASSNIQAAAAAMAKTNEQDAAHPPFPLAELVGRVRPPEVATEDLSETPPPADSHLEHVDFVLSPSDGRRLFGPTLTPKSRFAQYLNVGEESLVQGRVVGRPGQIGTYAELSIPAEGTDDDRRKLAESAGQALGVSHIMIVHPTRRWIYVVEGRGGAAVSAESIPNAAHYLELMSKMDRSSFTQLERSRARRLYLESVTSILESHWSSPGRFTDLTPAESALLQAAAFGEAAEKLKLDPPGNRPHRSLIDFAKAVVVQVAGGEGAVMGGVESAKIQLPEKEKKLAELMESRKKAYADNQIPFEDQREGPLVSQIDKMAQSQRLKDSGQLSGDGLRDFAATEKETEKMLDLRNAFVMQQLKGDAARKALTQIKAIEDQVKLVLKEKFELMEIMNRPQGDDEKKAKSGALLLPVNLLNEFRDLLVTFFARIRQTLQPENQDVTPLLADDVRLYTGRDVGIAIQKILERDKSLAALGDFPPVIRIPGEGYSIYSPEWHVLIVPLFHLVDSFQMMAHGIGEWRWSKIPEADRKKFQKAVKGGNTIRLDQLGIYFARDYRLFLDEKDVEDSSAQFIQAAMVAGPAPAR